jgi:hypothetical protein
MCVCTHVCENHVISMCEVYLEGDSVVMRLFAELLRQKRVIRVEGFFLQTAVENDTWYLPLLLAGEVKVQQLIICVHVVLG